MKLLICLVLTALITLFTGCVFEGTFKGALPAGRFVVATGAGGGLAMQTVCYRPGRVYLRLAVR